MNGRVVESAVLSDTNTVTAAFPIHLFLAGEMDGLALGEGLLGAGPNSEFARFAGSFAYFPQLASSETEAGSVIIGADRQYLEATFCESPLRFYPNNIPSISNAHWIVTGSVRVGSGPARYTTFLIDTGAADIYVPRDAYDETVAAINALGGGVGPHVPGYYTLIPDCSRWHFFPNITVQIGTLGQVPTLVTLRPQDYVRISAWGRCHLLLDPVGMTILGGARLLGLGVLNKLVTVFDRTNDQVGFCIA
jgi:hypothetical protein